MPKIQGVIKSVIFKGSGQGSSVYLVRENSGDEIVLVSLLAGDEGDRVVATGTESSHFRYGRQIEADSCEITPSITADSVIAILCSGKIPGVGKGTALKIVTAFGAREAIRIIESDPEALASVPGVGPKRAEKITEGWARHKANNLGSGVLILQQMGIPLWLSKKIIKTFLGQAVDIVRNQPYRLCREVSGVGFKTADGIALAMGVPRDSDERISAGLEYVLDSGTAMGDCGIHKPVLLTKAVAELGVDQQRCASVLDVALANPALSDMLIFDGVVYSRKLAEAEEKIANELKRLSEGRPFWLGDRTDADIHALICAAEVALDTELADEQRHAAFLAVTNRVTILTGGPGTGKTKTLQAIIYILQHFPGAGENGVSIVVGAPTGKAAKRASEVIGIPASTIHRMLGLKGDEACETVVMAGSAVVDEFSMMDTPLTAEFLAALSDQTALLIVGDVDQLESVGPGKVLRDIIDSGAIPVTRLTKVFRQAAGSLIIRNAHHINRGEPLERAGKDDDFFFLPITREADPEDIAREITDTIIDLVARRLPQRYGFDPMMDIQVLSPMNKGAAGVIEINNRLQPVLNTSPGERVTKGGIIVSAGDKIIQCKNNYDFNIFNGDIGFILNINKKAETITVSFDGVPLTMPLDAIDDIRLAYAMTIHKSQGSEAPAVIIPLSMQHYVMLQRNLLYTGVTRGKRLVVLVGQPRAIDIAVKNTRSTRRITRLKTLIQRKFFV